MESLQSNTFIQVVASCRVKELCSHLGMSAIATSLWGELRSLLHDYLPNNDLDSLYSEDKKVNFMMEGNSFIGWAIGNLHWSLVDELNETESEAEEAVLQARLDFVSRMRYLDHQEAQDKTYIEKCYDGIYHLWNCGIWFWCHHRTLNSVRVSCMALSTHQAPKILILLEVILWTRGGTELEQKDHHWKAVHGMKQ